MLSDEWLSRYELLENLKIKLCRSVTGTRTTGVTAIALLVLGTGKLIMKVLCPNHMHKPHAHIHSMQKTSANFLNNPSKTVREVAPTSYLLSIHFDSISGKKKKTIHKAEKMRKNNQRIIPKPHAHLHSMQKTCAKFQNPL